MENASVRTCLLQSIMRLNFVQDVEPGLPVRSQLAAPAFSVKQAFDKMKGAPFIVETKFDGKPCISSLCHSPHEVFVCLLYFGLPAEK